MSGFHDFSTLLGNNLETKQGQKPTNEVLAGKEVIGLYFSAHWCPPCRGFTPQLGKFYDSIKDAKNFEIIFVSSDRDASQFKEYYDEQAAWAALPFKDRATKNALSKKFKVRGIPTLVILDGKTGETITLDGRDGVSSEPEFFYETIGPDAACLVFASDGLWEFMNDQEVVDMIHQSREAAPGAADARSQFWGFRSRWQTPRACM